jgi:ketosteroid isomerase-like protein
MSQENVENAKGLTEAFNRLDLDAFAGHCTADVEWYPLLAGTVEGKRSFRGRQGIEEYFGELDDAWEELHLVVDEFRGLGKRVLALGKLEGRGRGSGVRVESSYGSVSDYRDGKVWCIRVFNDHHEALRAAGLAEETDQADV